jgi:outer membrane protein
VATRAGSPTQLRISAVVLLTNRAFPLALAAILLATLAVVRPAAAQDAGTQVKIAVVNLQEVVDQSEARKAKYKELETLRDKLQGDLDSLAAKIEAAQKDFESNAAKLSDSERVDRRTQIDTDIRKWRAEMDSRQAQVDAEEKKIMKEVFDRIDKTIAGIAEKEGYHLVLRAGALPTGSVVYFSPTIDITSKVLAQINAK